MPKCSCERLRAYARAVETEDSALEVYIGGTGAVGMRRAVLLPPLFARQARQRRWRFRAAPPMVRGNGERYGSGEQGQAARLQPQRQVRRGENSGHARAAAA